MLIEFNTVKVRKNLNFGNHMLGCRAVSVNLSPVTRHPSQNVIYLYRGTGFAVFK